MIFNEFLNDFFRIFRCLRELLQATFFTWMREKVFRKVTMHYSPEIATTFPLRLNMRGVRIPSLYFQRYIYETLLTFFYETCACAPCKTPESRP